MELSAVFFDGTPGVFSLVRLMQCQLIGTTIKSLLPNRGISESGDFGLESLTHRQPKSDSLSFGPDRRRNGVPYANSYDLTCYPGLTIQPRAKSMVPSKEIQLYS